MMKRKKRITSLVMFLVMLLTYTIGNISMKVHAATESINTTKGEPTKIYASAFVQNTDDWNWMSIGDNSNLVYQDVTNFKANNTNNVFAKSNSTANFGINIVDGNLAEGDSNILKFHIGTVTVKADGYDDLIINLNKDYSESLLGLKASWGLTGNGKQILLNDYLQKDATARTNYLHKITGITADITLSEYKYIKAVPQEPEFPADYKHPTTMRGLSAMDLVKDMKVGWNLGNTLEAAGGETGWGNPKTTKKMIDEIKKAGFSTVRIPVRWDENYTDANYTIDPAYMARVETVVNYVLANDMYAIINIHHNKIQGEMDEANKASVINEGSIVWTQIGERFKDYSDKLIFDTINEPRHEEDWVGTEEYYNVVNKYNAKILSAMRATGGNNEKRLVIMPTYCAAADYSKISAMVVPKDDNVAVSIHAYLPYDFALNAAAGSQATFGDADKVYLDKVFRLINKTFVEKGIPVVMDEFAATDKNNLEDRINFTKYYTQLAGTYGIPCCWWDNGNSGISSINNTMTLFNRKTLTFIYPEIIKALFDGWSNPKDVSKYDENMLFNGTATSSNWGQALSFYYGLDFVDADFSNKLAIAVEYTSEKAPQLVLSGNLTGVNWVTVTPAITKSDGTTNIAYFTLNDMVSAYKKALSSYDSYGRILPGLQTISVGDQGANLTVRKVYKIYVQKLEEKVSDATINEANKKLYVDSATENTATLSVTLPTELQKVVDNGLLNCKISYKTSDDKVVNVSQDGKITATGIGTTTITTTVILGDSTKSFTTTIEVKSSSAPLLGDVNADGEVDILDYIALQKYIVDPSTTITTTNANLNGDSKINTADLLALRKIILNS